MRSLFSILIIALCVLQTIFIDGVGASPAERAQELLGKMTFEEKLAMM